LFGDLYVTLEAPENTKIMDKAITEIITSLGHGS